MTPQGIASLVAKMVPKEKMLNADSVLEWRLKMAAELGMMQEMAKKYNNLGFYKKYYE